MDIFIILLSTWFPFGNDLSIPYQDWEFFWAETSSCIFQTARFYLDINAQLLKSEAKHCILKVILYSAFKIE